MLQLTEHRGSRQEGGEEESRNIMELEMTGAKKKPTVSVKKTSAPPPRPLSSPMKPIKVRSFTREEIDRYWRTRRMVEEDHLLFAEKAVARIRAKALKVSPSCFFRSHA